MGIDCIQVFISIENSLIEKLIQNFILLPQIFCLN